MQTKLNPAAKVSRGFRDLAKRFRRIEAERRDKSWTYTRTAFAESEIPQRKAGEWIALAVTSGLLTGEPWPELVAYHAAKVERPPHVQAILARCPENLFDDVCNVVMRMGHCPYDPRWFLLMLVDGPDQVNLRRAYASEEAAMKGWVCDRLAELMNPAEAATDSPTTGEWLTPVSLIDIANRLGNIGLQKARTMLKRYGLKPAGNRQLWTVRLDTMPTNIRSKLERAGQPQG